MNRFIHRGCLGLAVLGVVASTASADLILYDDAPQNGQSYFNNTGPSTEHVFEGTTSAKMDPGSYGSAGLDGNTATEAGQNTVSFEYYETSGRISSITFRRDGTGPGSAQYDYDNSNSSDWTVDGNPGSTSISNDTWHKLVFDLTAIPGYTAGTSHITRITPKGAGSGLTGYLDDARLVSVPEPASAALLGIGGLLVLSRRRHRREA